MNSGEVSVARERERKRDEDGVNLCVEMMPLVSGIRDQFSFPDEVTQAAPATVCCADSLSCGHKHCVGLIGHN